MGRIVVNVRVANAFEADRQLDFQGLVDTGSSGLVLPSAWRRRLEPLRSLERVHLKTADQNLVEGEVCGPVRIEIEGFRPIYSEVTFLDMEPRDGRYEPLIGYIVLEQAQAAVDFVAHRLVKGRPYDLKRIAA
jgi:predicted aspartyl protease